jgi:alginate O-acetyltransferase complex protein AlgI
MRFIDKLPRIFTHIYALALIILGWGLFYFDNLTSIGTFYTALFGQGGAVADIAVENAIFNNFWLWTVAIIFCMPTRRFVTNLTERLLAKNQGLLTFANISTRTIVSLIILILSVALLVGATNNAFIYTRF